MIKDLSFPAGSSDNDGITEDLSSMQYALIDNAIDTIQQLGRQTLIVMLDIKDTYRIVPVHPADYHLLGTHW